MHHTISDSSIQPTHRTSKSAPKFLPENHDENVCQPLCIGSWTEPASVGERSRILKFSTHHQDQSMESSSNEGEGSASAYPCRSLSGSVLVNGVDGVVLVVIQITDDPSAERTAPSRSTLVQSGDVSSFLIQQGGRRRRLRSVRVLNAEVPSVRR